MPRLPHILGVFFVVLTLVAPLAVAASGNHAAGVIDASMAYAGDSESPVVDVSPSDASCGGDCDSTIDADEALCDEHVIAQARSCACAAPGLDGLTPQSGVKAAPPPPQFS